MKVILIMLLSVSTFAQQPNPKKIVKKSKKHIVTKIMVRKIPLFY